MEQLFRAISTNFSHGIALIYPMNLGTPRDFSHPKSRCLDLFEISWQFNQGILRENTAILWFAYIGPNYTGPFLNARQSNLLAVKNFEVRFTNVFKEKFKWIP